MLENASLQWGLYALPTVGVGKPPARTWCAAACTKLLRVISVLYSRTYSTVILWRGMHGLTGGMRPAPRVAGDTARCISSLMRVKCFHQVTLWEWSKCNRVYSLLPGQEQGSEPSHKPHPPGLVGTVPVTTHIGFKLPPLSLKLLRLGIVAAVRSPSV